ncbi:MAG TPA: hypothetical protein VFW94_02420 [Candidatus Acidoferrales bacterium]|nr:hypothetical protein [Candidatus Acidoferrales bacterium]
MTDCWSWKLTVCALRGNLVRESCLLGRLETGKYQDLAVRIGFQLALGINSLVERDAAQPTTATYLLIRPEPGF